MYVIKVHCTYYISVLDYFPYYIVSGYPPGAGIAYPPGPSPGSGNPYPNPGTTSYMYPINCVCHTITLATPSDVYHKIHQTSDVS